MYGLGFRVAEKLRRAAHQELMAQPHHRKAAGFAWPSYKTDRGKRPALSFKALQDTAGHAGPAEPYI